MFQVAIVLSKSQRHFLHSVSAPPTLTLHVTHVCFRGACFASAYACFYYKGCLLPVPVIAAERVMFCIEEPLGHYHNRSHCFFFNCKVMLSPDCWQALVLYQNNDESLFHQQSNIFISKVNHNIDIMVIK